MQDPQPPVTMTGFQTPVTMTGSQPLVTTTGSQSPVTTTGSQPPVTTTASQTPVTTTGSQVAITTTDSQTPVTTTGSQVAITTTDSQTPVTTTGSQAAVRIQLSVAYKHEDRCRFRLQKMVCRTARDVLHQVYEWGTRGIAITTPLHHYLHKMGNFQRKKILQIFNKSQLDTLTADPSGATYDISLMYKCIQMVCEGLAPVNDPVWWTPGCTLEFNITSIKNFRNIVMHREITPTQAEFINMTEELRELLKAALEAAGTKYNIDDDSVDQCIRKMDNSISMLRDEPFQQWNITSVENELLFKEGLKLLMSVGLQELKENYTKWSYINPMSFLDGTELHLQVGAIFTQMEIVLNRRCLKSQQISNKDLLQFVGDGTTNNITLVEGVAGAGKTTLTKIIMSNWISGSSFIDDLISFDLVIYMECRNPVIQSLSQLLSTLMPKTSRRFRENDMLKSVLQYKVFVVVDGLDELNASSTKLLKEILSIKLSYDIAIFCTTRPEKVKDFFKMLPSALKTSYLKIIGIPDNMRELFVEMYHKEMKNMGMSTQETDGLIKYLRKTQNQLQEHLRLPLNLVLLTFLWAVGGDKVNIVTTATELYWEIHVLMIEKLLERLKSQQFTELLHTSELRSKIHVFLSCLYHESLFSIKNENIVLADESTQKLEDICSNIGLPPKEVMSAYLAQKTLWTASGIQMRHIIPHKGLQDFYSAMYLLQSCTKTLEASGIVERIIRTVTAPFRTNIITKILEKMHEMDSCPLPLEKYQNVLIHLTGLFHKREENMPMNITKELVTLLRESGIRDRDEWLDLLASVKCNTNMVNLLVKQIPEFLIVNGRVDVEDSRVDCYANLLPLLTPKEVIVKIRRKPQDIPRLEALLVQMSQLAETCQYQVELHLEHLFRHPASLDPSLDSVLQQVLQKCRVREYWGGVSEGVCGALPPTLHEVGVFIATTRHGCLLPHTFNTSTLSQRFPLLNKLCVHVGQLVETSVLVPLPPLRYLEVYVSQVTRQHVSWVVQVARALQPTTRGYSCMRVAGSDLRVESCHLLMKQLKEAGVTVWGGFYVASTNIRQVDEAALRDFTENMLGCVFWRMQRVVWVAVGVLVLGVCVSGLENGLARTPPMGWLAWQRFRCNTDCVNDPHNCISESLFMQMADIIVNQGYHDLGYNMVSLDDCWLSRDRDARGRLQPDPFRFPSGIAALADYMHKRGMKFGIYEDYGNFTCAGYPGILGHLQTDAQTFADWGVDYVKLDGCYSHPADMDRGYPLFGFYLNQTLRPMVYSCSWPVYQTYSGMTPNYTSIINTCNLWRNFDDIQDSWESVQRIIDYYGDNQDDIVPNAGPGHWNDPDMLIIGNFGLSYEQSKSQMGMWAIFAAPLLMSVDLRTIRPEYKAILQNRAVIAVNQDPLGIQGKRIYKDKGIEIWARPITPVFQSHYSYAIAFLNRRTDGTPSEVSVTLRELGLTYPGGYAITDLFDGVHYGTVLPDKRFKVDVNPSGVVLVRCELVKSTGFGDGGGSRSQLREQPPQSVFRNPFQNHVVNQFGQQRLF